MVLYNAAAAKVMKKGNIAYGLKTDPIVQSNESRRCFTDRRGAREAPCTSPAR